MNDRPEMVLKEVVMSNLKYYPELSYRESRK
jgi:hypothetical protein